ncbi:MAG: hypothetical protein GY747_02605 [Planctomycetes bacterium]|nr:hypothetical protein [Planctomycetota bacterium]MCP4770209.1 hypothetical protein [Planctomycetota bacterium]MCP4860643.1 hypothetical protein [Planctomycetota bacterium]
MASISRLSWRAYLPKAMRLFGFRDPAAVQVNDFRLGKQEVPLGGELQFHFALSCKDPLGKLRLEYRIDFARPHGRGATKVFKISESESTQYARTVERRHYVGEHKLTLIVNGVAKQALSFDVRD